MGVPNNDYVNHYDWQDCPECGGSGVDDRMCECQRIEDTCFCVYPKPVPCEYCDGLGGWEPSNSNAGG